MAISRNQRRKLIHLAFCVCAKEVKHCKIEQNSLRWRYPDTNYGLTVTTTTKEQATRLSQCVAEAFARWGYTIYTNRVTGPVLELGGFYAL